MRGGFIISGLAHVALIVLAIWGLPRTEDDAEEIEFSEVSLISVAEFDAMQSAAPAFEEVEFEQIVQPEIAFTPAMAPEAEALPTDATQDLVEAPSEQDSDPDVTAIRQRVVEPDVALDVEAPVVQENTDTAFLQPEAVPNVAVPRTGAVEISRPPAPRQALNIDTTEAPRPPEEAEPDVIEEPEVVPDEQAEEVEEVVEPDEPTAPVETTTEDTLEDENATPPVRPQQRPDNIQQLAALAEAQRLVEEQEARLAQEAVEAAAAAQQEPEQQQTDDIAALIGQASEEQPGQGEETNVPQDLPLGAEISLSERESLRLAVQSCWSPPIGIQGAGNLQVTLAIELKIDGSLATVPELISPRGSTDPGVELAFEAARRALIQCGKRGFNLPADKFGRWQKMEVTFDPGGMVGW